MIINVTGHFLTFQDRHGQTFRVGPCGMVINATPAETLAFCQRDPECAAYSDYEHARADCACVEYVKVTYSVTDDTLGMLTYIEQKLRILCPVGHLTSLHHRYCDVCNRVVEYPDPLDRPVIVGSMIAAQAFPGRVVSPVLTPETARLPYEQKVAYAFKFQMFEPTAANWQTTGSAVSHGCGYA